MNHEQSVQAGNEVTESVTLGAPPTPTHDPLCPWAQEGGLNHAGECFLIEGSEPPMSACDLIAKVRADTLNQVEEAINASCSRAQTMFMRTTSPFSQGAVSAYADCLKIVSAPMTAATDESQRSSTFFANQRLT